MSSVRTLRFEVESIMASPGSRINPRSETARARRIVLFFGCGFLVLVAILLRFGSPSTQIQVARQSAADRPTRDAYIGSPSCAQCHPGEFAAYTRSGHAHTLRPAAQTPEARKLNGSTFDDPEHQGVRWKYMINDGHLWTERHEGEQIERFLIDYAFGSGRHATTFVTLTDRTPDRPTMIEHRLTKFTHKEKPDITPGQGQASRSNSQRIGSSGRHYPTWATLKCFECHTTATSKRGPLVLDEATMIHNVGCERCHGPGRAHVLAAARDVDDAALAMPFGLGRWTAADEIRLCGACHRLPEMGDHALIRPDNAVLVRFQPVGLMQSACYAGSKGTLSCTTCHDPHAKTSTDRSAYEAVCLSCHKGPAQTACKVSPASGCVSCHMPRRDVSRGMMMTDHWIRSRPEATTHNAHVRSPGPN
jgi:hypothetical protein